ncbi:MAG: hypothetical protein ACRD1Z_02095, partial [Vicinamibacteria bacterium]
MSRRPARVALSLPFFIIILILSGGGSAPRGVVPLAIADAPAEAPLLEDLTREAALIVIGRIVDMEPFAEGALFVHRLQIIHILKGEWPETEVKVVEEKLSSVRIFREGRRMLVFLGDTPTHSLYSKELPPGKYFATLRGKEGAVEIGEKETGEARRIIETYLQGVPSEAQERLLVQRELRAGQTRFVYDGVLRIEARLAEGA